MKIETSIASTTHIDLHCECMTRNALDSMANQIKTRYIPRLIEHDWNRCIGVVLYGEVFQLKDGEYALGIVTGLFENDKEKEQFKTGEPNCVWQDYKKYLEINKMINFIDEVGKKKMTDYPTESTPNVNIVDLMETHLDSTQVLPDGTIYKVKRFIAATGDLRIEIHPDDHDPAHFHVISKQRGINARFNIETLELLESDEREIRKSDIRKIQNFFKTTPWALVQLKNEYARMHSSHK